MSDKCTSLVFKIPQTSTELTIPVSWVEKREKLIAEANAITITDDVGFQAASDLFKEITKVSNMAEKQRKEFSAPFQAAQKGIKKNVDAAREPLETAKTALNKRITAWAVEQRKIEAQQRKEAEERAQAEAAKRVEEQATLNDLGLDEEEVIEIETEKVAKRAVSSSVRVVTRIVISGMDDKKIPRSFLTPSQPAINAYINEHKEELKKKLEDAEEIEAIAGVTVRLETKTRSS